MNFPIPVDMTVQGDVTVSCVVDLRISPNVHETYDGPYSVTPTESVQTLETDGKLMADNVSVGAIPGNYVGSQVPRKTSADLTASGPTVTAPAGYYSTDAQKTIPDATYDNNITIGIEPDIYVTTNGLIGVSKDEVSALHPVTSGGYAATTDTLPVGVWAHNSLQLDTQAGTTITPTEQEQTAVVAQKYTTGEVKVGAISSSYVGSAIDRRDSTDLSVSGAIVTAPAGYYAEAASKAVPSGSASTPDTSIPVHVDVSLSETGLITATVNGSQSVTPNVVEGYVDRGTAGTVSVDSLKKVQLPTQAAQTITPTTTDQTIDSRKFLTGAQTIKGDANLLPENIKKGVTIFGVVGTYDGG